MNFAVKLPIPTVAGASKPSARNPIALLKILTLDPNQDGDVRVVAQYNPKEVQIDCGVKWEDHPGKDGSLGLEFGAKSARTMTIELFFDSAETPDDPLTVRKQLDVLQGLTENLGKGKDAHPPRVSVLWGDSSEDSLPRFPAVIESLNVKYQMFSTSGKILRATATVKLKESGTLGVKKKGR